MHYILFLLAFLGILNSNSLYASEERPILADRITYWSPEWFGNDRIIYIKQIEHMKHGYGLLAEISKGATEVIGEDHQICTVGLEGKNEQVIRSFSMKYRGGRYSWTDDFFKGNGYLHINNRYLSYNQKENLIAFSVDFNFTNKIIVLTADGKKIWQLNVYGINPKISPDGKTILYRRGTEATREKSIWLVNIDGTNNRKIVDNATNGIWHPDGERIIFYREPEVFILNLKDNKEEFLRKSWAPPLDISATGTKIVLGGVICDFNTKERILVKNTPRSARISPDETKVLGEPIEIGAKIAVVNMDGTNLKKVLDDYSVVIK
jgi:hypothetical protein